MWRVDRHSDNVAPCWDGGDCCPWSCELNCNAASPCDHECGHWGSHNRVKNGYICLDDRKPFCLWGGYCYDSIAAPATRPLYYAWSIALWVTIGFAGWMVLMTAFEAYLAAISQRSHIPSRAQESRGVTYVLLWLLLIVGDSLGARLRRGLCMSIVPLCVCIPCLIAWATLMRESGGPSPPPTPIESVFRSTLEPGYWFGRISLQVTGPLALLRLIFTIVHSRIANARRAHGRLNAETAESSSLAEGQSADPTTLPLYTLVGSCVLMSCFLFASCAKPPAIAIAAEADPTLDPIQGSATLNSGLLGGSYLLVVAHVQISRTIQGPILNLRSSPKLIGLALGLLICWLCAAAGFTFVTGVLVAKDLANKTGSFASLEPGDYLVDPGDDLAVLECVFSLLACIACIAVAGTAAAKVAAPGASEQVAILDGSADTSIEFQGRQHTSCAGLALSCLLRHLTAMARLLRLEYSILFGRTALACRSLFAHSSVGTLGDSDPITAALVVLVAALIDVVLLLPRLLVTLLITVVSALIVPLLLVCGCARDTAEGIELPPNAAVHRSDPSTVHQDGIHRAGISAVPTVMGTIVVADAEAMEPSQISKRR